MLFSKKWLRNHQKFLLHFQIHIDVLMLCRKFEPIPSSNFRVMTIFKNEPISEKKSKGYSPWFSLKNGSEITRYSLQSNFITTEIKGLLHFNYIF